MALARDDHQALIPMNAVRALNANENVGVEVESQVHKYVT